MQFFRIIYHFCIVWSAFAFIAYDNFVSWIYKGKSVSSCDLLKENIASDKGFFISCNKLLLAKNPNFLFIFSIYFPLDLVGRERKVYAASENWWLCWSRRSWNRTTLNCVYVSGSVWETYINASDLTIFTFTSTTSPMLYPKPPTIEQERKTYLNWRTSQPYIATKWTFLSIELPSSSVWMWSG